MEWFKHCPICHQPGIIFHIESQNQTTSFCPSCFFNWRTEPHCKHHTLTTDNLSTCLRDGNIGECKGELCPRLKEIKLDYLGFNQPNNHNEITLKTPPKVMQ